eukprot:7000322-Pyramimonas_sp.AAC.1
MRVTALHVPRSASSEPAAGREELLVTHAGMYGSDPGSASAALQGGLPELSRKDSRPRGCLRSPGFSWRAQLK